MARDLERFNALMEEAEQTIWRHPETGYREWKTQEYIKGKLEGMGYVVRTVGDIPGLIAEKDTGRPGPVLALLAEMDSLVNFSHPDCDRETGAVHACGHHAQCASLLGTAALFAQEGATEGLCGKIRFMFVPAEELIEIAFREELRKKGVIHFFGGKAEFMRRGLFDDVDLVVMLHTGGDKNVFHMGPGMNGCMAKDIRYRGKAAHAGGSPDKGINALYAADLGMMAVNSLRETFRDDDHIRFHPIMTGRPGVVNVIPDSAVLESYVRGASLGAIDEANRRINRALVSSAAAIGAQITIYDRPGYSPVQNDSNMYEASRRVMEQLVGKENVLISTEWGCGSTDMGDISCVFPAIHPSGSGAEGIGHGADYRIADRHSALTLSAAYFAGMCDELLGNGAACGKYIIENKHTLYKTPREYTDALEQKTRDIEGVTYTENGAVLAW